MSSLAAKIAKLANPEPVFMDPGVEEDYSSAKVTENDLEFDADYVSHGNSSLRSLNASLLDNDSRYKGKKTSRETLALERGDDVEDIKEHDSAELGHMFDFGDDSDEDEVNDEDNCHVEPRKKVDRLDTLDYNLCLGEFEDDSDDEYSGEETSIYEDDSNQDNTNETGKLIVGTKSSEQEISRGKAVQKQLLIWDKLLETRIQQQKVLSRVNRIPVGECYKSLTSKNDTGYFVAVKESQKALKLLLNDLVKLERILSKRELEDGHEQDPNKKLKLGELSNILEESHTQFQQERNSTIQKWNDKTRISVGKVSKSFSSMETSTLVQIEQILANRQRLIARTQIKRTNYHVLWKGNQLPLGSKNSVTESDKNIFDDDDFYHELLRDLIERKTSSSSDQSQITRQWLEVQKLRTKLKKKVDTKASKGRKVRYDIHAKLVNFMAPVYSYSVNEESKKELFLSIFGGKK